jgi:arsenate reductase
MRQPAVLFVCTGNSVRSQMAEGLLRKYAGDHFDVYSAGLEPKGVNPLAIEAMKETGVDIANQRSKSVTEYLGKVAINHAVFVCSNAEERCPRLWPGVTQRLFWPFDDPAAAEGTHEEKLAIFREVRDEIEGKILGWLSEMRAAGELPTSQK